MRNCSPHAMRCKLSTERVLPLLRASGDPAAFSLTRSEEWLIVPLFPVYQDPLQLNARTARVARLSPYAAALLAGFIGPHLRSGYEEKTDRVGTDMLSIACGAALPVLKAAVAQKRAGTLDATAEADARTMIEALLNGFIFVRDSVRTPYPSQLHRILSDIPLNVGDPYALLLDALQTFTPFQPSSAPNYVLCRARPLASGELEALLDMNRKSPKARLADIVTDTRGGEIFARYSMSAWPLTRQHRRDYRSVYALFWDILRHPPADAPAIAIAAA